MSINLLYKYFLVKIIKNAHLKKWNILLHMFYPSLKFKVINYKLAYNLNVFTNVMCEKYHI